MKLNSFTTNYDAGEYYKPAQVENGDSNPMIMVNVYSDCTYQTIKGFGGAFTEASAYNLSLLSAEKQEEVMNAYFGEDGLNYNLCRTHINSCDFGLGNYAYVEDPEDTEFKTFNIDRERRYVIPMIKKALEMTGQKINILASPWSPPAFMKSNGEMNHGGVLKKEYYGPWAAYIAKYLKTMKDEGITISMLTVQNEPEAVQTWDSCIYTVEDEREFVGKHLGPELEKQGLSDVKILIWDHNKEIMYQRTKGAMDDPDAAKYIAGTAFHWYSGDHFEAVALVHEKYPDLELYFTEGCVEYSRFADSNEVYKAEMYAHDILGNLNAGTNGYMDWNMLLDEKGGPNHVGNFCAAPMMCNPKENTVEKRLTYYYIGHFSKYIQEGAVRLATTRYTDKIEVTAFKNPDGTYAVVLLNRSEKDVDLSLRIENEAFNLTSKAHTIMSAIIK